MAAKPTGIFADIMNDLNAGNRGGNVQFLKDGDTTLKLLMPEGRTDPRLFYQKFNAWYKGEAFPYFLVCAVITEADEDGVADPARIRYVKVTKSIMLEIVNLMQKKWKLFEVSGPVITITKGKKSGKVAYNVAAIPETFDAAGLTFPEQSIEDAALGQEEKSLELDSGEGKPAGEALA